MVFRDRQDAGRRLGTALAGFECAVVLGLPRGGVPVAAEVARQLGVHLGIVVARKVGHPGNPEYAIGAVTEDGVTALNEDEAALVDREWLNKEIDRQREEARRRRATYAPGEQLDVADHTVIIVDDGIATGYTVLAAIRSVRAREPARIVVAAPVAPPRTIERLRQEADEVVVLHAPEDLFAIGAYYEDFSPVSDRTVKALLAEERGASPPEGGEGGDEA